jgi:hypothetical protein
MSGFNLNDAEPQSGFGDLIPNGTITKVNMTFRPGGAGDEGLFKQSNSSDVQMLDCEFTVQIGQFARRKVWQFMTVSGGALDDHGQSKGWKITKSFLRAAIESAFGINPKDESEGAKAKRNIPNFGVLNGLEFAVKIGVEKGTGGHPDKNKIAAVVTPDKKEWATVMQQGQDIVPGSAAASGGGAWGAPAAAAPAPGFGAPAGGAAPAAGGGAAGGWTPPAQQPAAPTGGAAAPAWQAAATGAPAAGPAWMQK